MDSKTFPSKEQGQRIKELRKKTHLSRRAFGEKHGIPRGSMQNWEDGRYKRLSKSAIQVLLHAFAAENIPCSAEYLLAGTPPSSHMEIAESHPPYRSSRNNLTLLEKAAENAHQREIQQHLLIAVATGRDEEVNKLLKNPLLKPQSCELYNDDDNTPLHTAAKTGHLNIVRRLVEHGYKLGAKNKFHQTPLHLAVKYGFEEIVNYLILNGANVNTADKNGETPLAWACKAGQTAIARQLIKLGANINTKNSESYLPIHWAALHGYSDLVGLLLEHGSKTKEKNVKGDTPLNCAVKNGYVKIVQLLSD